MNGGYNSIISVFLRGWEKVFRLKEGYAPYHDYSFSQADLGAMM